MTGKAAGTVSWTGELEDSVVLHLDVQHNWSVVMALWEGTRARGSQST